MTAKPKFTPGPWSIPDPEMGFSSIYGPNGELIFGLAVGSDDEKQPDDICEANASLIKASPKLYEALLAMMYGHQEDSVRLAASAALAEARGER